MSVVEILEKRKRQFPISFEVIPPERGGSISSVMSVVEELIKYNPMFIDVTSHPPKIKDSKKAKRQSPGTLPICTLIQERYKVPAVPHVLCNGFTREETEDLLIDLSYAGIDNVMALQGDDPGYEKHVPEGRSVNKYASDLVRQIQNMNKGVFLDDLKGEPTKFHIGVAGYPEKHFQAPNFETDIKFLKEKVDAGAEYIVTQFFYGNEYYFRFVELCRKAGINVPIFPGLKVLTTKKQLKSLPERFHLKIPEELEFLVNNVDDDKVKEVGAKWVADQTLELLKNGIPSVHFYVMQSANPIKMMMEYLKRV
ncbi:methylenetetrahydrofolate reductase [Candidatus Woesearchaeota archaeon]|nr:methylenetetrahydrofolate reductase [Candidatus Woesearchaeota archaeon]